MSKRSKIWSLALLGCLLLTVSQMPNFTTLWREYDAIRYYSQSDDAATLDTSMIGPEAAAADPEAADILGHLVSESDMDALAALVLKYPHNELFAFELANQLLEAHDLSPQAALTMASNLITLDPRNAHYRYLKAYLLLNLPAENSFEAAISELELGNRLSDFKLSYSKYKQRVESLLGNQRKGTLKTDLLAPDEGGFYGGLNRKLTQCIEAAAKKTDRASVLRLTRVAAAVGDTLVGNAHGPGLLMKGALIITATNYLKFKHAELSPHEAEQVRFHLARGKALMDIVGGNNSITMDAIEALIAAIMTSATLLALFAFSGLFCFLTLVVALLRKHAPDVKVSFKKYIQYGSVFLCYFVFVSLLAPARESLFVISIHPAPEEPDYSYLLFLVLPIALWTALRLMGLLRPCHRNKLYEFGIAKAVFCAVIWIQATLSGLADVQDWAWDRDLFPFLGFTGMWFAFCLALWAALVYGWFLIRLIPYRRLVKSRGLSLILLAAFLAGLTRLLSTLNCLPWLPLVLLIPCSAIILTHRRSSKMPLLLDALYRFFGKREEIAATRAKVLRVIPPYMIISWLILLPYVGSAAANLRRLKTVLAYPPEVLAALPLPDRSTYQSILDRIDFSHVDSSSLPGAIRRSQALGYLPVLGPKDLPAALRQAKTAQPPAEDYDLLQLMERCGPDVYDIILKSLDSPQSEYTLIARAKSGDATVKTRLLKRFDDALSELDVTNAATPERTSYRRFKPRRWAFSRCFGIASALAAVSEPNEAMTRFMNVLDQIDSTAWHRKELSIAFYFHNSLDSLPRPQASKLLKSSLKKTDYSDLSLRQNLSRLEDALALFADCEIAEQVFIRISESPLIRNPLFPNMQANWPFEDVKEKFANPFDLTSSFRKAISPHFRKRSIPVLKNELHAEDPALVAYVVWQLTRLGYEWPDQELKQLLENEHWKVRANALLAAGKQAADLMQTDDNNIVRVIAAMIATAE
ncbi:MAG: hypothetical protein JSU94_16375 [Phycisphaerales bacterium]|nr:MAG: hypothetical protein JSU94_16375 [Phycisphaerales bacterium]